VLKTGHRILCQLKGLTHDLLTSSCRRWQRGPTAYFTTLPNNLVDVYHESLSRPSLSASSDIAVASSSNQGAAAMELGLSQLLALLQIATDEMTAVSTKPLALANLAFLVCSSGARMASRALSFSLKGAVLVRGLLTRKGTCPNCSHRV